MAEYYPQVEKKEIDISISKKSKGKIIFVSFLLLVLLIIGIVIWQLFLTNRGVFLNINTPKSVMIGEKFPFYISINNKSLNNLSDAELVIKLPPETYDENLKEENEIKIPLQNIQKGENLKKTVNLRIISPANSVKKVKVVLKWKVSGFQVGLEKEKSVEITMAQPIIKLTLNLPKKIIPGVPFTTEIVYKNNLLEDIEGAILKVELPDEFKLESTKPVVENVQEIVLGKILASQQKRIILNGRISNSQIKAFNFKAQIGFETPRKKFLLIDQQKGSVSISESLLPLNITLNGSRSYIAQLGQELIYTINYTNRTEVALSDVIIKAHLEGDLFEPKTLVTNGYFDPIEKTIIWNGGNEPNLKLVGSQETNHVSFRIRLKKGFPSEGFKENFELKVKVEIESLSVPYYVAADKLTNVDEITNKVMGDLSFECSGFFRDPSSGFVNNGPWPPKVGQPTEFTIHFKIKNYATDLENVKIKSILDNGVVFEGVGHFKKSDNIPDPVYNKRTNEFSLLIPRIKAWQGIKDKPLELIFQIKLTPSVNQIDLSAGLIKNIYLEAKDTFTGLVIMKRCQPIETGLLYKFDKTVNSSQGKVEE